MRETITYRFAHVPQPPEHRQYVIAHMRAAQKVVAVQIAQIDDFAVEVEMLRMQLRFHIELGQPDVKHNLAREAQIAPVTTQ